MTVEQAVHDAKREWGFAHGNLDAHDWNVHWLTWTGDGGTSIQPAY